MTLDDRAHRAADGLRRSVRRSVDPEAALDAVTGRGDRRWGGGMRGSRSPERVLAAVAAVALLVGTVAFAVTRTRGGVDSEGDPDRELVEALPAGPLDGKESLRLPMVVSPQEGVSEGSVVQVGGRGFEPGERVGAVMCASEADTGHAGVDACQLGETFEWVTYSEADMEGIVSLRVPLRRFVDTPKYGRVDCLSGPERCLVAVGAVADYDRSGGAYVRFAGAPDFPTPTLSVEPSQGLADGQTVEVVARAMVPGRTYVVEQCAAEDRCTPLTYGRLGDDGTVTTAVSLHREVVGADGTPIDCTTVCEVRISYVGPEGASSAPEPEPVAVTFDPSVAPDTDVPTTGVPGVSTVPPPPQPTGPFPEGPTTLPPTSSTTAASTTTTATGPASTVGP